MVESIIAKSLNVPDMFINKIPITHSYFELDTSDFAVLPSHIFYNQNIFLISIYQHNMSAQYHFLSEVGEGVQRPKFCIIR